MRFNDDIAKIFLIGVTTVAFLTIIVATILKPELSENTLLIHIVGIIEGALLMKNNFFFGSSKSSQDKDKIMRDGKNKDSI